MGMRYVLRREGLADRHQFYSAGLPTGGVRGTLDARPGQFVEVRNHAGDAERLAVIGARAGELDVECIQDGSVLREWLDSEAAPGTSLRIAGPFDRPR